MLGFVPTLLRMARTGRNMLYRSVLRLLELCSRVVNSHFFLFKSKSNHISSSNRSLKAGSLIECKSIPHHTRREAKVYRFAKPMPMPKRNTNNPHAKSHCRPKTSQASPYRTKSSTQEAQSSPSAKPAPSRELPLLNKKNTSHATHPQNAHALSPEPSHAENLQSRLQPCTPTAPPYSTQGRTPYD